MSCAGKIFLKPFLIFTLPPPPLLKCPLTHCTYCWKKISSFLIYITRNWIENQHIAVESRLSDLNGKVNTLRTGDADLRLYITTVQDGLRKSAFLTRACFFLHNTLNYAIQRACLRMVLLTDVHRNLTSL